MAIVRRLEPLALERDAPHREVQCTYSIIHDDNGQKYLQLDTYGSRRAPVGQLVKLRAD
jgi:hypothetical protein